MDWNSLLAMSVISMIPVIIVFVSLQKYIIGGMTAGVLKGRVCLKNACAVPGAHFAEARSGFGHAVLLLSQNSGAVYRKAERSTVQ